ncbi:hypothetical protein FRC11_010937, partial [Ceratobasidium sp. 423]
MGVHDHLFHLCVNSPLLGYDVENKSPWESTGSGDNDDSGRTLCYSGVNLPGNSEAKPSIEGVTLLVSSLFESGLISVAQVYHYISRLTKPPSASSAGSGLPGVCTLLEVHGRDLNIMPWRNKLEELLEWVKTVMLERTTDEYTQRRVKAIMLHLNEFPDQELCEEADHKRLSASPNSSSGGDGSPGNNYGSHAPRAEIGPGRPSSLPTQPTGAFEPTDLKVGALLDRLEAGDFDTASEDIIEWINESGREEGGRTLKQATGLIYRRAVGKPAVSGMYARLCRKMVERISPNVRDETVRDPGGQIVDTTGGMLFRKYLLRQCHEDFQHDWTTAESEVAPEAYRGARRYNPRPVEFIGELFKLQMLTERIVHECIQKLLSNVVNPEEEEIESLCKLLTTFGQRLDNPKARNHMDIYFERMQGIAGGSNINSQMRLRLLDVIELRARRWKPRSIVSRPPSAHQGSSRADLGRHVVTLGGPRKGGHRGTNVIEPDGWNIPSGGGATLPSAPAGDPSQFGKIQKPTGIQFGPSSVFSKKDVSKRDSSIGRAGGHPPPVERTTGSRKPSVDLGPGGSPATASGERRKLNLLPGTKPTEAEADTAGDNEEDEEEGVSAAMTEEEAQTKVKEDVREYLGVKNIDEAITALEALPSEHRHLFVDKLINASMDGGNKVVILAEKLFSAARSRSVISPEGFERGFLPTIEMADDLSIDVPKTYQWLARMMHAAGLDKAKTEEMADRILVWRPERPAQATPDQG